MGQKQSIGTSCVIDHEISSAFAHSLHPTLEARWHMELNTLENSTSVLLLPNSRTKLISAIQSAFWASAIGLVATVFCSWRPRCRVTLLVLPLQTFDTGKQGPQWGLMSEDARLPSPSFHSPTFAFLIQSPPPGVLDFHMQQKDNYASSRTYHNHQISSNRAFHSPRHLWYGLDASTVRPWVLYDSWASEVVRCG